MGVGIVASYFQLWVVLCRVHNPENIFCNILLSMLGHAKFGTPCFVLPPDCMFLVLRIAEVYILVNFWPRTYFLFQSKVLLDDMH